MSDPDDRRPTPATANMGTNSRTPRDQAAAASSIVQACWNDVMPRNRVRFLTGNRWAAICAALATFTAEEICLAIRCYAGQSWQRSHQAWKTFDSFLDVRNLTQWIEKAMDEADRREQAANRQISFDQRVRQVATNIGQRPLVKQRRKLTDEPPNRQIDLLRQALTELQSLGQQRPTPTRIRCQAQAILDREITP
jgi:hypothetical protein